MGYEEQERIAVWHRDRHADNEDVGIVIKYIGDEASCTIEVSAGGDILSKIGAVSLEEADPNFTYPAANGGTAGTLDLSDTAMNTFGEVVDFINALDDYEAHLVDVLRADSSDDTLLLAGVAQAKVDAGLSLKKDSAVALNLSIAIMGENLKYSEDGCKNELDYILSNNAFTGTNKIQIYEDETKVNEWDGGLTGEDQELDNTKIHHAALGKKVLLRMIGSAACTGFLIANVRTTRLVPRHKYRGTE